MRPLAETEPRTDNDSKAINIPGAPPPGPELDAWLNARREKPVSPSSALNFLIPLLSIFLFYVIVGEAVGVWREEGGSLVNFFWAFLKTYGAFLLVLIAVMIIGALLGLPFVAMFTTWGPSSSILLITAISLWYWAGSYNWARDLLLGSLVLAVVVLSRNAFFQWLGSLAGRVENSSEQWMQKQAAHLKVERVAPLDVMVGVARWLRLSFMSIRWRHLYTFSIWILLTWILVSIADIYFGPTWMTPAKTLATDPARFSRITYQTSPATGANKPPTPTKSPQRLGVALSGGGFRAALMHAGVLASLEELQIPIAGLATVSGGSIIGGFYVLGGKTC